MESGKWKNRKRKTVTRDQRTEDRGQRTEDRGQRTENKHPCAFSGTTNNKQQTTIRLLSSTLPSSSEQAIPLHVLSTVNRAQIDRLDRGEWKVGGKWNERKTENRKQRTEDGFRGKRKKWSTLAREAQIK